MPKGLAPAAAHAAVPSRIGTAYVAWTMPDHAARGDWYSRMPAEAQKEWRIRSRTREAHTYRRARLARDSLLRSVTQGIALLLVTELAFAPPSPRRVVAALVAGTVAGAVWNRNAAGRFGCPLIAVLAWFALHVVVPTPVLRPIPAVSGFVALVLLSALVGFVRERRRADGFDH